MLSAFLCSSAIPLRETISRGAIPALCGRGSRRGSAEEQRDAEAFNKYELWEMSYEVGVAL